MSPVARARPGLTSVFFQAHAPVAAGVEILLLLAIIVALIALVRPLARIAAFCWPRVPRG
ncbi:MAG: tryptophan-rich sensory protein [Solirubrobacteraceae bacterium]|nr:tryptophan-rich sensory protein [Solirubrobacteraceae bacterium]